MNMTPDDPIADYYRSIEERSLAAWQKYREAKERGEPAEVLRKLEEDAIWAGHCGD